MKRIQVVYAVMSIMLSFSFSLVSHAQQTALLPALDLGEARVIIAATPHVDSTKVKTDVSAAYVHRLDSLHVGYQENVGGWVSFNDQVKMYKFADYTPSLSEDQKLSYLVFKPKNELQSSVVITAGKGKTGELQNLYSEMRQKAVKSLLQSTGGKK
ncbi:MAG: hypothetical protein WCG20_00855 [bacterium]